MLQSSVVGFHLQFLHLLYIFAVPYSTVFFSLLQNKTYVFGKKERMSAKNCFLRGMLQISIFGRLFPVNSVRGKHTLMVGILSDYSAPRFSDETSRHHADGIPPHCFAPSELLIAALCLKANFQSVEFSERTEF